MSDSTLPGSDTTRRPGAACRRRIRERLIAADRAGAQPFVEEVVRQAAVPLGLEVTPAERAERERRTAGTALALLLAPEEAAAGAAAGRLLHDPPLLAALFQNIDLLYRHAVPGADALAARVMEVLARLEAGPDASVSPRSASPEGTG